MLGCQLQQQSPFRVFVDLILDICSVIGKFVTELFRDLCYEIQIIDDFDPAENDHAFYRQCPVVFFFCSAVKNTVRNLIVFPERVQTVAFSSTMKIDFSTLIVIPVIHGHAVWVAAVTDNGKNASLLSFKYSLFSCLILYILSLHVSFSIRAYLSL